MDFYKRIYLKTLTGDTFYLNHVLKSDTTVSDLKDIYSSRRAVHPNMFSLFHEGKELDENISPDLSNYGLKYGSSITVVIKTRGSDEPIEELENFLFLYKKCRKKSRLVGDVIIKPKNSGFEKIIWSGVNGPLFYIFRYIDPLELLYNFVLVNSCFNRVIFHMIERGFIKLNDFHLHTMFRQKLHISESLFLKLVSYPNLWNEETEINQFAYSYREPMGYANHSDRYIDRLNLLQTCVVLNYPKGFRYLIEERKFRKLYLTKKTNRPGVKRPVIFDYLGESCRNREEIFHYLIDTRPSGFHIYDLPLRNLLLSGDWERFRRLIEDRRNTIGSCYSSRPRIIVTSYGRCLKHKPEFGTLEKWKELELGLMKLEGKKSVDFLYEGDDYNKSPIRYLSRGFPFLQLDLLVYLLFETEIKFEYPPYVWTPELCERTDFIGYIIDHISILENINIYLHKPRFMLIKEAVAGNFERVREMIEKREYRRRKDRSAPYSVFPYSEIRELRIVEFLIRYIAARPGQVERAEEDGRIELAQVLKKNVWKENRLIFI